MGLCGKWKFFHLYFITLAPAIFPVCYNLVKHIFSEETRRKIFIFGCKLANNDLENEMIFQ